MDSIDSLDRETLGILSSRNILIIDNALDADFCQGLIKEFVNEPKVKKTNMASDFGAVSFRELNLTQTTNLKRETNIITDYLQHYEDIYKKTMKIPEYAWPKQHAYEEIRMKEYSTNLYDRFDPHVDAANYASARRFLVMFWYLNDVMVGGETAFYFKDLHVTVKPKTGRLICFPPMWTHPHAGLKPVSNPKYIMGSYLHFL